MTIPLPDTRSLSDDVREALRLRAVAARAAGFTNDTIAAILGVRLESVSRWVDAAAAGAAREPASSRGGPALVGGRVPRAGSPGQGGRGRDPLGRRDRRPRRSGAAAWLCTAQRAAGASGVRPALPRQYGFHDH